MSKVFAIHTIELKPGVRPETFEQFVNEEVSRVPWLAGWTTLVARGDRGERRGKYVVIHVFDSEATRNMYFPSEGGEISVEAQQLFSSAEMQALGERWDALATPLSQTVYTDYVVVE